MSWETNEKYVNEALKRLESSQQELFAFIREHMEKEEAMTQEIRERLIKLELDAKWHSRIFSVSVSAAASIVAFVAGKLF